MSGLDSEKVPALLTEIDELKSIIKELLAEVTAPSEHNKDLLARARLIVSEED